MKHFSLLSLFQNKLQKSISLVIYIEVLYKYSKWFLNSERYPRAHTEKEKYRYVVSEIYYAWL